MQRGKGVNIIYFHYGLEIEWQNYRVLVWHLFTHVHIGYCCRNITYHAKDKIVNNAQIYNKECNNIPTMQFFTGISRNTQSKSYMLSLTECVWEFQNVNMPYWCELCFVSTGLVSNSSIGQHISLWSYALSSVDFWISDNKAKLFMIELIKSNQAGKYKLASRHKIQHTFSLLVVSMDINVSTWAKN